MSELREMELTQTINDTHHSLFFSPYQAAQTFNHYNESIPFMNSVKWINSQRPSILRAILQLFNTYVHLGLTTFIYNMLLVHRHLEAEKKVI